LNRNVFLSRAHLIILGVLNKRQRMQLIVEEGLAERQEEHVQELLQHVVRTLGIQMMSRAVLLFMFVFHGTDPLYQAVE
jgi:hypothetical protein